jgi:hypothetical protein
VDELLDQFLAAVIVAIAATAALVATATIAAAIVASTATAAAAATGAALAPSTGTARSCILALRRVLVLVFLNRSVLHRGALVLFVSHH